MTRVAGLKITQHSKPSWGRIPHRRTAYNGVMYDSITEAGFAKHLDMLRRAHHAKDKVTLVEPHVPYHIKIKRKLIFTYIADFRVTYGDGTIRVYDVKSTYTAKDPVFSIKKKAVEAYYGIKIEVIKQIKGKRMSTFTT